MSRACDCTSSVLRPRAGALFVSDLDIALDAGRPVEPAIIQQIADALDELSTLRKVDIVDLRAVDKEFASRYWSKESWSMANDPRLSSFLDVVGRLDEALSLLQHLVVMDSGIPRHLLDRGRSPRQLWAPENGPRCSRDCGG